MCPLATMSQLEQRLGGLRRDHKPVPPSRGSKPLIHRCSSSLVPRNFQYPLASLGLQDLPFRRDLFLSAEYLH